MAGISLEILEEEGQVGKYEVNVANWNKRGPVVDVREWWVNDEGEKRPGKGITLKATQIDAVINLLQEAKNYITNLEEE